MPSVLLAVPDLSCGHCVSAIQGALAEVPGLSHCEVDLSAKRVRLEWEAPALLEDFLRRLADEGYPAQPLP